MLLLPQRQLQRRRRAGEGVRRHPMVVMPLIPMLPLQLSPLLLQNRKPPLLLKMMMLLRMLRMLRMMLPRMLRRRREYHGL